MNVGKISRNIKNRMYITDIRPAVLYVAKILSMTNKNEDKRTIIRRTDGHKKIGIDEQRPLMNFETAELLEGEDMVRVIKLMKIPWYGHVLRRE